MKKKAVALLLSLSLCLGMAAQTGMTAVEVEAEEISDGSDDLGAEEETLPSVPETADNEETEDSREVRTEETDSAAEEEDSSADTAQSEETEDMLLSDSSEELDSGETATEEEIQSSELQQDIQGESVVDTGAVEDAEGATIVSAADWVKVSGGWKLIKHTTDAVGAAENETEVILPENAEAEEIPSGEDENVVKEVSSTAQEEDVVQIDESFVSEVDASSTGSTSYYTLSDGIVKISTVTVKGSHTGYYLFDTDGIMVTGKRTVSSGTPGYGYSKEAELYFTEESTAALYSEYANVAKSPVTSDLGQQKKNYWLYENGKFRLYGASGMLVSIKSLNEKYKEQGYVKINGEYYCLKDDGTPRTGEIKINGSMYYFEPDSAIPGRMFREGWKKFVNTKGEKWVYYNRENKGKDRGKAVKYNGYVAITITPLSKTTKYLLDHNGYIVKSKRALAIDGAWYGSNAQGQIYKNKVVKYGNYRYYFTANGKQVGWTNMWKQCPAADNRFYYFGSTPGRISEKTGWQRVTWPSGKFLGWFYFTENGEHYRNTLTSDYYFDSYGKLAGGVTTVNGKTYFFEFSNSTTRRGKMIKGTLIDYNGNQYYAETDGQLANNTWKEMNGYYYRFENYVMLKDAFRKMGSTYGYLDTLGRYRTGWIVYSNTQNLVKYVNPNEGGFYTNTSAVIDGLRYYFDSNGYRINDLTSVYAGSYSVKVDRVNGVLTVYDSTGTVPVKSVRVSVGTAATPTPLGTYTLRRGGRWQLLMGPSYGQYASHVYGAGQGGIFIHSVSGSAPNSYSVPAVEYNKLGNPASHGCIRTCVADCKWIYENCIGATITIYDGTYYADEALKGPLGRWPLEPMRYPYNFDPTDPAV